MYAGAVHLNAVFITPLLALLTDTIGHNYHAVVPQATDDRLRDGSAGCNLRHAGLTGNGTYNICRCPGLQVNGLDNRNWCRYFVQMDVPGKASHHYGIKLQVLVKNICGIRMFLCVHHCAYA